MKKVYAVLLLFFSVSTMFSQGIAIQGIARDNANSAITDTNLTFTFSITKSDNTVQYSETQSIKTDNFGVFSHVVNTGNPVNKTFNDVDFSIPDLKMKVSVNYNSSTIEVYDQTFQYTPYAHFAKKAALATNATNADDGVPTGSIMPYVGTTAPTGWVLCKGQNITSVANSAALIALVGNTAPNLQGMFLRGTGQSVYGANSTGPSLRQFQGDLNKSHDHSATSNTAGNHTHSEKGIITPGHYTSNASHWPIPNSVLGETQTSAAGSHQHIIIVSPDGGSESRPVNYGVNYIIKL
jgi:microcystin-dependent protein